jgi:hypothetical protein
MGMKLELKDKETELLKHALGIYLRDLRGEIVKTDKKEWKDDMHKEEDILKDVLLRMN